MSCVPVFCRLGEGGGGGGGSEERDSSSSTHPHPSSLEIVRSEAKSSEIVFRTFFMAFKFFVYMMLG